MRRFIFLLLAACAALIASAGTAEAQQHPLCPPPQHQDRNMLYYTFDESSVTPTQVSVFRCHCPIDYRDNECAHTLLEYECRPMRWRTMFEYRSVWETSSRSEDVFPIIRELCSRQTAIG